MLLFFLYFWFTLFSLTPQLTLHLSSPLQVVAIYIIVDKILHLHWSDKIWAPGDNQGIIMQRMKDQKFFFADMFIFCTPLIEGALREVFFKIKLFSLADKDSNFTLEIVLSKHFKSHLCYFKSHLSYFKSHFIYFKSHFSHLELHFCYLNSQTLWKILFPFFYMRFKLIKNFELFHLKNPRWKIEEKALIVSALKGSKDLNNAI